MSKFKPETVEKNSIKGPVPGLNLDMRWFPLEIKQGSYAPWKSWKTLDFYFSRKYVNLTDYFYLIRICLIILQILQIWWHLKNKSVVLPTVKELFLYIKLWVR